MHFILSCHVSDSCGGMGDILGVRFHAVHGDHLLPHSRTVLSVGPQVSGQIPWLLYSVSFSLCYFPISYKNLYVYFKKVLLYPSAESCTLLRDVELSLFGKGKKN